jgi:hypothetical protein
MRPGETLPVVGAWGIKENNGLGEFNYEILEELS